MKHQKRHVRRSKYGKLFDAGRKQEQIEMLMRLRERGLEQQRAKNTWFRQRFGKKKTGGDILREEGVDVV